MLDPVPVHAVPVHKTGSGGSGSAVPCGSGSHSGHPEKRETVQTSRRWLKDAVMHHAAVAVALDDTGALSGPKWLRTKIRDPYFSTNWAPAAPSGPRW